MELKMESPTNTFRETNHAPQPYKNRKSKIKQMS